MPATVRTRGPWWLWLLAGLLIPLIARASHADDHRLVEKWRWVRFTRADGLPEDRVRAVVETADGVVWAATASGLARYDGWAWVRAVGEHGLGRTGIRSLAAGPRGKLWVVVPGAVFRGGAGGFEPVALPPGVTECFEVRRAGDRVALLARGETGRTLLTLDPSRGSAPLSLPVPATDADSVHLLSSAARETWVSIGSSLLTWDGGAWTPWLTVDRGRLELSGVSSNVKGQGIAGIVNPAPLRGVWEWRSGEPPRRNVDEGHGWVVAACVTPDGGAIAVYDTGDVRERRADGEWQAVPSPPAALSDAEWISSRANGDLWVGGERGLYLCRAGEARWDHWRQGFQQSERDSVNEVLLARDGILWIASGQGVEARRPDGTPMEVGFSRTTQHVTGLAEDARGHVWAVSGGAFRGARVWDGTGWRTESVDALGEPLGLIHKARAGRDGRVWLLGVARDLAPESRESGAVHVVEDGRIERWRPAEALGERRFYDFAEDPDGAFWVATSKGAARYADGAWTEWGVARGAPDAPAFAIEPAADGGAWVAQKWGGLVRIHADGTVARETRADLFLDTEVWDVDYDGTGRLWVTTDTGVACYRDGHWSAIGPQAGLEATRLWPVAATAERLYVGSRGRGVWSLDLRETHSPPPRVRLRPPSFTASAAVARWSVQSRWGKPAPELVETRSRLNGGPWTEWSTTRSASFSVPGGGAHVLDVQAKGPFGSLSPIASRSFSIPLALTENPRFLVPMGLLAVALVSVSLLLLRRHRRTRAIEKSEARLSELIEQASDAIVVMERDTSIRMVNAEAVALLERARGRLVGQRLAGFLEGGLDVGPLLAAANESGDRTVVECVVNTPDAATVDVEMSLRALADGRVQAILRDLSDRRRAERERLALERRLAEKQRLEALGLLAGGVAHDFNNMLTAILGNVDLALCKIEPGSDTAEALELIKTGARNAAGLTQQLLTFAGRDALVLEEFDVNGAVRETVALLRPTLPEAITVRLALARDLPTVQGDASRLRQVILNLIVNAVDSLGEDSGSVTVATSTAERSAALGDRGDVVQIKVIDDGCGMDRTTIARIFDPFFTTKTEGRGLGLAAVRGILRRHNGAIRVASQVGAGTSFVVSLPAAGPRIVLGPAGTDHALSAGCTLIVDDEPQVLDLTAEFVTSLGYQPLCATTGEDAVRIALAHAGSITNAVIDLRLVGMEGHQVVDELRRHFPHLPVVIVSGWDVELRRAQDLAGKGVAFLSKPFTIEQLRETLEEAAL